MDETLVLTIGIFIFKYFFKTYFYKTADFLILCTSTAQRWVCDAFWLVKSILKNLALQVLHVKVPVLIN